MKLGHEIPASASPTGIQQRDMDWAWRYTRSYAAAPFVIDDFALLANYRPEVFYGFNKLRQGAFNTGRRARLSPKMKELIILAIEIAERKVNPPPVGHAVNAVLAGATPADVAEVVSLCIYIGGILTYTEAGRFALRAAEERYTQLHAKRKTRAGRVSKPVGGRRQRKTP